MSGDHDKYHGYVEVVMDGGVYLTREKTQELIDALEDAVYLLNPTKEDMQKKKGVYRIVTALEKLKEENA
jgi:hypothetical protein